MVDKIANEGPEKISWGQSLSPLEHKLIGSTPPNMSIAGVNTLIDRASDGEGDALGKLLIPIILGEGVDRSLIEKAREDRREIGPNNIFGTTEPLDEDFPLKGYTLYVRTGKLSDRGLTEGFDVEFFRGQEDRPAVLSEDVMFSLLEILTKKRTGEQNTIYQLLQKDKLKVSFSTDNVSEEDIPHAKTVMRFRYNFGLECEKRPDAAFLSPLEYKMMGSSPVIGEEALDVNSLLRQAAEGNEQALQTLLSPQVILEKDKFLGNVGSVNRARKGIKLKTPILLSDEWKTKLSLEYGLEVGLEPSGVDSKGLIIPEWTMRLLDGNGVPVENREVLNELEFSTDSTVGKYLELKPAEPDSDTRTLVLRLPHLTSTSASNAV